MKYGLSKEQKGYIERQAKAIQKELRKNTSDGAYIAEKAGRILDVVSDERIKYEWHPDQQIVEVKRNNEVEMIISCDKIEREKEWEKECYKLYYHGEYVGMVWMNIEERS